MLPSKSGDGFGKTTDEAVSQSKMIAGAQARLHT